MVDGDAFSYDFGVLRIRLVDVHPAILQLHQMRYHAMELICLAYIFHTAVAMLTVAHWICMTAFIALSRILWLKFEVALQNLHNTVIVVRSLSIPTCTLARIHRKSCFAYRLVTVSVCRLRLLRGCVESRGNHCNSSVSPRRLFCNIKQAVIRVSRH